MRNSARSSTSKRLTRACELHTLHRKRAAYRALSTIGVGAAGVIDRQIDVSHMGDVSHNGERLGSRGDFIFKEDGTIWRGATYVGRNRSVPTKQIKLEGGLPISPRAGLAMLVILLLGLGYYVQDQLANRKLENTPPQMLAINTAIQEWNKSETSTFELKDPKCVLDNVRLSQSHVWNCKGVMEEVVTANGRTSTHPYEAAFVYGLGENSKLKLRLDRELSAFHVPSVSRAQADNKKWIKNFLNH